MSTVIGEWEREDVGRTTVAVDAATRDRLKKHADRIIRQSRGRRKIVPYDEVIQLALDAYEKHLKGGSK
jgi:hypothetical protein